MRYLAVTATALLALAAACAPAYAFPPTATISPGYDRALAESRRARAAEPAIVVPPVYSPRQPLRSRRHDRRH